MEKEKGDAQAAAQISMRLAVAAHKRGRLAAAERLYRAALTAGPHPGARILLANLLLATSASAPSPAAAGGVEDDEERDDPPPGGALAPAAALARRAEALALARSALEGVDARAAGEQWRLRARYAYFLLQLGGFVQLEGAQPDLEALGVSEAQRAALLAEAVGELERVLALQPRYVLAWRNLCVALTAAGRLEEAERAAASAVAAASAEAEAADAEPGKGPGRGPYPGVAAGATGGDGAAPSWELLYKHGKCLKRLGRGNEALERYCDACEASRGAPVVLYWMRIALANDATAEAAEAAEAAVGAVGSAKAASAPDNPLVSIAYSAAAAASRPARLPAALRLRLSTLVRSFEERSAVVPHDYVRKLFDGYRRVRRAHPPPPFPRTCAALAAPLAPPSRIMQRPHFVFSASLRPAARSLTRTS